MAIGLNYSETLKGFLAPGFAPPDDYADADKAAQSAGQQASFTIAIQIDDIDKFVNDRAHEAPVSGKVVVDSLTSPDGAQTKGTFNLFTATGNPYQKHMLYWLPFTGRDGKPYALDGWKDVRDHGHFDVWASTTTLYTRIREGWDKAGRVVATGILHVHFGDLLKLISSMHGVGGKNEAENLSAKGKFLELFMGTIWKTFGEHRLQDPFMKPVPPT